MTSASGHPERTPRLVVTGPTACGKTAVAVYLARRLSGEIVSADSRQVYRGMDLGTGKDLEEYGKDVPYHLIDITPAGDHYNLFRYLRDARRAISEIDGRGHLPVVCGGTGMYVEALMRGRVLPQVPENSELRSSLRGKSLEELTLLLSAEKTMHNTTDVDTVQRAVRALEITRYYRDHPEEEKLTRGAVNDVHPWICLVLDIDREERRRRISARLDRRLESGMVDEVRRLLDMGVPAETLINYGLEYRFITQHLLGQLTFAEMRGALETAIHQFAKRQMTWFRGMERRGIQLHWVPYDLGLEKILEMAADLLSND